MIKDSKTSFGNRKWNFLKQEMEFLHPFIDLRKKKIFKNMMLIWSKDSKSFGNRKWNYFSVSGPLIQKLLSEYDAHMTQGFQNKFWKQEMEFCIKDCEGIWATILCFNSYRLDFFILWEKWVLLKDPGFWGRYSTPFPASWPLNPLFIIHISDFIAVEVTFWIFFF